MSGGLDRTIIYDTRLLFHTHNLWYYLTNGAEDGGEDPEGSFVQRLEKRRRLEARTPRYDLISSIPPTSNKVERFSAWRVPRLLKSATVSSPLRWKQFCFCVRMVTSGTFRQSIASISVSNSTSNTRWSCTTLFIYCSNTLHNLCRYKWQDPGIIYEALSALINENTIFGSPARGTCGFLRYLG